MLKCTTFTLIYIYIYYILYIYIIYYIYIYIYSLTGFGTHSAFCLRGGPGIPQQQEEPRPHLCAVQEGGRED